MQKIILFIEPTEDAFETPFKIGHLFMNRFTIEEEANFEIVKIFELGKSSGKISWSGNSEYSNFEENRNQKGMSLSKTATIHMFNHIKVLQSKLGPPYIY